MCHECVVCVSYVNMCLCCERVTTLEQAREARSGYSIDITLHVDTPRPDVLPPPATAPLSYTHTPPHISRTTLHTTTTRPSHTSAPLCLHPQHHLESTSPGGGGGGGKGPVGWVVEVDGPSHYQQHPWHRATGSTQLKRRHLQSLGLALVSIPYWEWNEQAVKGQQACQAYLQVPRETPIFPATVFFGCRCCVLKNTLSLTQANSLTHSFVPTHTHAYTPWRIVPSNRHAGKIGALPGAGRRRRAPLPVPALSGEHAVAHTSRAASA